MATFLLWNVQRKALNGHIVELVREHDVDVVVLVECPRRPMALLAESHARLPSHPRFGVFVRATLSGFERLQAPTSDERVDYWRHWLASSVDILFVSVHGPDRIHGSASDADRRLFFERVHENVRWLERQLGHRRTLVVGDFNANPFEESIGGVQGLHAISVRNVGGRHFRKVRGRDCEFFFNPMWSCYGGGQGNPPGTYYYNGSQAHELFWHMLDQIVMRPDLLPYFREERLRILRRAGPVELVTRSRIPDRKRASDHLPLLFQISHEEPGRSHGEQSLA